MRRRDSARATHHDSARATHHDSARVGRRDDEGTVLVLVLGFTLILTLMVGVVVNVSAAALARRSVASAADGGAVAAAQALDLDRLYAQGLPDGRIPLSPSDAARRVGDYAAVASAGQPGLTLAVTVQGSTATVVAVREVRLPFSRLVGLAPLRVQATARARSPVAP